MQGLMAFYVIVQVIKSHNESLAANASRKTFRQNVPFAALLTALALYRFTDCLTGAACLI